MKHVDANVSCHKVTLLGWSFKKDTNDSRESAAIYVADILLEEGAEVHVFDPMVKEARIHQDLVILWEARNVSNNEIEVKLNRCAVHKEHTQALDSSFAAAILTEWDEFKSYDWNAIAEKMMQPAKVFDGRNIIENSLEEIFSLYRVGT